MDAKERNNMPAIPKKKAKKKKPTMKQLRKRLDRIWYEQIYERDKGLCQYCKREDTLAPHHIFGKKAYPAGRWNKDNGVLLCFGHHFHYAHGKPEEFRRWVIPWLCKRTNTPVSQAEEMYDWLFVQVQKRQAFRACDFESKRKELEEK